MLWIDDKGTPSTGFLGQTRTHTLKEDSSLGGRGRAGGPHKALQRARGRRLGSVMFRDDRGRSACTGLQPVLGSARRSPRSRVAGVCEDVRKIIPPQVRVEGSVWCPCAPAFGRACRIMLLFPVHGASLCKAAKIGHVTTRCSCTGG